MSDLFIGFMVGTAFLGCVIFIWQAYIEKAWWKAFVKRHIVDYDPYDGNLEPEQYVDWSKLKSWAKYVAVDETDGSVWQYDNIPPMWSGCWVYEGDMLEVPASFITSPLPTWRESLRKRPI